MPRVGIPEGNGQKLQLDALKGYIGRTRATFLHVRQEPEPTTENSLKSLSLPVAALSFSREQWATDRCWAVTQ